MLSHHCSLILACGQSRKCTAACQEVVSDILWHSIFSCTIRALQVCTKAGLEPSAISYIEAHGTGTVAGDGQELGALEEWYGRSGNRTAEDPLLIGSVKSNMGHCEGCSGLAGLHLSIPTSAASQPDHACQLQWKP